MGQKRVPQKPIDLLVKGQMNKNKVAITGFCPGLFVFVSLFRILVLCSQIILFESNAPLGRQRARG